MSDESVPLPIRNHAAASPMVSIIIVNWNRSALTLGCLRHIAEHTRSIPHEVIVVDNGSDPGEVEILRQGCAGKPVRLMTLRHNRFFGEANNIGVEAAAAEHVLLINNDATVTPGYLQPLLAALGNGFRAGAIGPRFVYPDGRLQEAGTYVRPDGWTVQHGKTDSPNALIAGPGLHIVDYCSAACLLLRRDIFLSVGGFDPLFEPGYFEDADLCLRLRSIGLYTYYCGDVTVIHEEGASYQAWQNEEYRTVIAASHQKFVLRWGQYLKERTETDVKPVPSARIEWRSVTAPADAASIVHLRGAGLVQDTPAWRAILAMAATINRRFPVVLVADEACSRCRIYSLCNRLGLELRNFSVRRFCADIFNDQTSWVTSAADATSTSDVSVTGPLKQEVEKLIQGVDPLIGQ